MHTVEPPDDCRTIVRGCRLERFFWLWSTMTGTSFSALPLEPANTQQRDEIAHGKDANGRCKGLMLQTQDRCRHKPELVNISVMAY
eukprot:COSAG02_NODE_419_length_22613_cov_22.994492_24_plen_86_part_00